MPKEQFYDERPPAEHGGMIHTAVVAWGGALSGDVYVRVNASNPDNTQGHHLDVKLNRNSINTLIRTLRHARDKAFGRDE